MALLAVLNMPKFVGGNLGEVRGRGLGGGGGGAGGSMTISLPIILICR